MFSKAIRLSAPRSGLSRQRFRPRHQAPLRSLVDLMPGIGGGADPDRRPQKFGAKAVLVKSFGCRRMGEAGGKCRAGVGKSPGKEPARDDQQGSRGRYGDFGVVGCILDGGEQREAGHSSVAMGGSCDGRKRWGVQSGEDLGSICCGGQRLRRAAWRLGDDQRG